MLLKYLETTSPTIRESARPSVSTRADAAARILIVDDDPEIRRDYSEVLIRAGYRVDSAEDGEAEWRLLDATKHNAHRYDLVITNNLPHPRDAAEQTSPAPLTPKTLLVVLTPQAGQAVERIQLAAILPRPFDPEHLPERVRTIMRYTRGANSVEPQFSGPS